MSDAKSVRVDSMGLTGAQKIGDERVSSLLKFSWRSETMNPSDDGEVAKRIAKAALPCPLCGELMQVHSDHHGYWVAHREEPGPCCISTIQLFDEKDLAEWNTRALSQQQEGKDR